MQSGGHVDNSAAAAVCWLERTVWRSSEVTDLSCCAQDGKGKGAAVALIRGCYASSLRQPVKVSGGFYSAGCVFMGEGRIGSAGGGKERAHALSLGGIVEELHTGHESGAAWGTSR